MPGDGGGHLAAPRRNRIARADANQAYPMKILIVDDEPAIADRTADSHIRTLCPKLRAATPAPVSTHRRPGYGVAVS